MTKVKVGVTIRVLDGENAVPEIRRPKEEWVLENGVRVRPGKGSMRDVKLPPPLKTKRDIVEYLLEDRYGRDTVDDIIDEYLDRLRKEKQ